MPDCSDQSGEDYLHSSYAKPEVGAPFSRSADFSGASAPDASGPSFTCYGKADENEQEICIRPRVETRNCSLGRRQGLPTACEAGNCGYSTPAPAESKAYVWVRGWIDVSIQGGDGQETWALEKFKSPSGAGPPSRWWKRFGNLPVVRRLRGWRLRRAAIQT